MSLLLAIDLAKNRSGWAVYEDRELVDWGTIRLRGNKGKWAIFNNVRGLSAEGTRRGMWTMLLEGADHIVIEQAFSGKRPAAGLALSRMRGYLAAVLEDVGIRADDIAVPTWQRLIVGLGWCEGWPAKSAGQKALSIALATRFAEAPEPIGEDESDAILIGRAWLATQPL